MDLADDFLAARRDETALGPLCCEQDTHWSPCRLTVAAARVGAMIQALPDMDLAPKAITRQDPVTLVYAGDLVDRVEGHPVTVRTTQVARVMMNGRPVTSDPASPIILPADIPGLVFSSGDDMRELPLARCRGSAWPHDRPRRPNS